MPVTTLARGPATLRPAAPACRAARLASIQPARDVGRLGLPASIAKNARRAAAARRGSKSYNGKLSRRHLPVCSRMRRVHRAAGGAPVRPPDSF
ncbi:hypothetical protein CWD92_29755 [Burkholderia thailandensis]|nr:hypothetical protein CWD92_29755 [Burkholderia thailandensis]